MMKFRNFILTVSLCVAALWPSQACIDYADPSHYNLFLCAPEMPNIDAKRLDESAQFWGKYLGMTVDEDFRYAVGNIYEYMFDEDSDVNIFINALRKQGKTDALQLVKLNFELEKLNGTTYSWDYKKITPADYNALLSRIDALRLTGDLSRRKTFLKMRCLFALKDYDACMRLWDMFASKWEESPLKQRAYGYVAGIYFRKGQFEKAMQIYFEQGDAGSIRMCVNRILQNSTIEKEYEKDPNAPILSHFLEDYANYFYHSTFDEFWKQNEKENPIWSAVNRQRSLVLALAERVIKEGKTRDPQLWQAFIGFVQLAQGEDTQAHNSLVKAEQMKSGVMADRIGLYKLAAALKSKQRPGNFDDYLGQAFDKVFTLCKEGNAGSTAQLIATNMLDHEFSNRLTDYLHENKPAYMLLLAQMCYTVYDQRIYVHDHVFTTDDIRQVLSLLENGTNDVLTQTFLKHNGLTKDAVHEYLGTLLMREGKFEEAATHLAQVSQQYIWDMSIAPYLFMRELPERIFTRKTHAECYGNENIAGNPKLDFCRQVITLQQQVANSKKDEKAKAAIQLANLLFQGSIAGDLWAMSEYFWSSYGMHSNEFDQLAIPYLREAISATKDTDLLSKAYFGLAAVPLQREETFSTIANTGVFYNDFTEDNPYRTNAEAYRWLIKQKDRSSEVYQTCDWLKLYQPESLN